MIRFGRRRRRGPARVGAHAAADASTDREQALASAARLVAAERIGDAIRLLTEANRVRRDRQVERRLVDLRFEAFRAMRRSTTRPVWPDVVEDLFPGERIPEISREELTVERVRSGIQHHGSLLVRGLIGRDHVDRLVGDIDAAVAAFDAHTDGVDQPDVAGWYQRFEPDKVSDRKLKRFRGAVMTVESPPTMFDLQEAFEAEGVGQLVRDYFGEPPMLLARKGTLRRVSRNGKTGGWHQDGAFMGSDIRSLNIWLALSHCGDDAPGLDIVGRRLDEIVQTGEDAFTAWATSPEAAERVAAGAVVRPIFDPGDALIFDQMNLHRTAIDPGMEHDRYAIETWLLGPSTYNSMTSTVENGYSPRDQLPILF